MKDNKSIPAFLKPLRAISPTAFCAIRECALKEVWRQNGKPSLLPSSPKAHLGTVAHKLLAEAGQGKLEATEVAVNARWRELAAEAGEAISRSPLERHLAPLDSSVPDIEVLRIRATSKALDIASKFRTTRKDRSLGTLLSHGHEVPVRSSDNLIRGAIDAVIRGDRGGSIIQDYKSGSIVEPEDGNELRAKEIYQVQMKMYAGLYAETFGEWPDSLELVSLTGEKQNVPFTKDDCSNLLNEARATLQRVNETIRSNSGDSLPSTLATPSPEACTFCQFRPDCAPYWSAVAKRREEQWPLDVTGTVESIRRLGNSKVMLVLTTDGGTVKVPSLSPGDRHPALLDLQPGDMAGVFNLRRSRPTAPYSESRLTAVHNLAQVSGSS